MRRLASLALFTCGYLLMAALDASVAAAPCLVVFAAGAYVLVDPQ